MVSTLLLFAERDVGGFEGVATFVMTACLFEAGLDLCRCKPEGRVGKSILKFLRKYCRAGYQQIKSICNKWPPSHPDHRPGYTLNFFFKQAAHRKSMAQPSKNQELANVLAESDDDDFQYETVDVARCTLLFGAEVEILLAACPSTAEICRSFLSQLSVPGMH